MAEIISQRHRVMEFSYTWDFQRIGDYEGNGYSFPVDANKECISLNPVAQRNLEYCQNHPEEYEDRGIVTSKWSYMENAKAKCECGKEIELYDEYLSACECPYCGRWHNLFGQLLNNPEAWSDGDDW